MYTEIKNSLQLLKQQLILKNENNVLSAVKLLFIRDENKISSIIKVGYEILNLFS